MSKEQSLRSVSPSTEGQNALKGGGNPALRMMGLPQIRARLPSRNWLIFLSLTTAFAAALTYDRHHKKQAQRKWCNAVSHLADESLPTQSLPRRVTVFLEAPPGDYLSPAREHFKEYVKPILVAAALEWDLVEGRREGEIRYKLAQQIRDERQRFGKSAKIKNTFHSSDDAVATAREKGQVYESEERGGDLVIGRHTWKEYIRGLHEGWLGPLHAPSTNNEHNTDSLGSDRVIPPTTTALSISYTPETPDNVPDIGKDDSSPFDQTGKNITPAKQQQQPGLSDESNQTSANEQHDLPKTKGMAVKTEQLSVTTSAYINPSQYPAQTLPESIPSMLPPSVAIGFPHLLGFTNTPIRIWRFIHQRKIAEDTGASVAAFILARDDDLRPFKIRDPQTTVTFREQKQQEDGSASDTLIENGEWQYLLEHEERDWHKSARLPNPEGEETKERPWQDMLVVDNRLAKKMRTVDLEKLPKYLLAADDGQVDGFDFPSQETAINSISHVSNGMAGRDINPVLLKPRGTDWKGGVDRCVTVTWREWFGAWIPAQQKDVSEPWKQALEPDAKE